MYYTSSIDSFVRASDSYLVIFKCTNLSFLLIEICRINEVDSGFFLSHQRPSYGKTQLTRFKNNFS